MHSLEAMTDLIFINRNGCVSLHLRKPFYAITALLRVTFNYLNFVNSQTGHDNALKSIIGPRPLGPWLIDGLLVLQSQRFISGKHVRVMYTPLKPTFI